jgi:hypothetical protein
LPRQDRPPPRSLKGRLSYDEVEELGQLAIKLTATCGAQFLNRFERALVDKVRQELEEVRAIRGGYA